MNGEVLGYSATSFRAFCGLSAPHFLTAPRQIASSSRLHE
jgi:hypothetical protein